MGTGVFPQYMTSRQVGAPQMTNGKGQILQVLDACLVTGFNSQTIANATFVGDNIVFTFGVTHGYSLLQYIDVSGALDVNLNGRKRIISTTNTTVTISKGLVTDLSGTITTKVSPLGWESIFGTTDPYKRAYRSKDITSTRSVLYLDCNLYGTGYPNPPVAKARVDVCADMVNLGEQIDSYTNGINNNYTDGYYHFLQRHNTSVLSGATDSYQSRWAIIGDGKLFYFLVDGSTYSVYKGEVGLALYTFGDIPKLSQNDNYNCVLTYSHLDTNSRDSTAYRTISSFYPESTSGQGMFIKGFGGSTNVTSFNIYNASANLRTTQTSADSPQLSGSSATVSSNTNDYSQILYPNPLTMGLDIADISLLSAYSPNLYYTRGCFPYFKFINNNLRDKNLDYGVVDGVLVIPLNSKVRDSNTAIARYGFNLLEERAEDKV